MDVHFTASLPRGLHEVNCIIEYALNIFLRMVLQVVAPVDDTFARVVVCAIVRCTVDHMRDSGFLELVPVSRDNIAAQVQVSVDNL